MKWSWLKRPVSEIIQQVLEIQKCLRKMTIKKFELPKVGNCVSEYGGNGTNWGNKNSSGIGDTCMGVGTSYEGTGGTGINSGTSNTDNT